MSGSFISTGMLTNEGNNFLDISNDLDNEIEEIVIHNIPLSQSNSMAALRAFGKILTPYFHSALTPTLSHIAIQLMLKNSGFIYIIEYGQYFTKDSEIKSNFFSSSSSNEPRTSENDHDYYYINKDGARITRLSYNNLESFVAYRILSSYTCEELKDKVNELKTKIISGIIAEKIYNEITDNEILLDKISKDIYRIECDIKNKITLRELINNFKNENWSAREYNVATHNSQTFAAEIIKILKAIRMHEADKIRSNEKIILPNCLIKALWNNEDLSMTNTLGRIPIFGYIKL